MKVGLLTEEEANSLIGVQFEPFCYYNPIIDGDLNWIISTEEIGRTTNSDYLWVKSIPLIDFVPPLPVEFE